MRNNYVLIDFENVQPDSLDALAAEHFRLFIFVGANQTKLSTDVAISVQRLGGRAEYIRISGNGPNALDFHIAYYIGSIAAQDPSAYFHIVSKDTGFDPLIQHLRNKKIFAARSRSVLDIPLIKATSSKSMDDRLAVVIDNLRLRGASKPRTPKTLATTINSIFQKQLADDELVALLERMKRDKIIVIDGSKVSYALPEKTATT